jgi:nitroreductase
LSSPACIGGGVLSSNATYENNCFATFNVFVSCFRTNVPCYVLLKEKLGEIKKDLNATFTPDTETGRAMLQMQKAVLNNSTSLMFYTYAPEPDDPHRYDMGRAWLFAENLCLAAVYEGLGTQLFAYWDDAEEEVNQVFGVPEKYKQVIGVNVGIPDPAF